MDGIARKWPRYQLSLKDRIMIAKTFLLPQFTYIASVLAPDTKTYDTTIKILLNFINTGATKVSGKGKWKTKQSCMDPN